MQLNKSPFEYHRSLLVAIAVWLAVLFFLMVAVGLKYEAHPAISILSIFVMGVVVLLSLVLYRSISQNVMELVDQLHTREIQLREALARLDELYLLVSTSHSDVLPKKPFLRLMKREMGRASRIGTPLTVVAMRFKDAPPEGIGKALRMVGRTTDYVGREGDTYYFLLLDTDQKGGEVFVSRLAERLSDEFGISREDIVVGMAELRMPEGKPQEAPPPEALLEKAVEAMEG